MSKGESKRLPPGPRPVPEGNVSGNGEHAMKRAKQPTTPHPTVYDPKREQRDPAFAQIEADLDMDKAEKAAAAARAMAARKTTTGTSTGESITGRAIGRRSRRRKRSAPTLPPQRHKELAATAAVYARMLRRKFADDIKADLNGFRSDLLRVIAGEFPLRRGRPTDPLVDDACEKVEGGMPYTDVLRGQIPNYDALDPYHQYLLAKGLRMAVSRRRPKPRKGRRIKACKRTEDEHPVIPLPEQPVN